MPLLCITATQWRKFQKFAFAFADPTKNNPAIVRRINAHDREHEMKSIVVWRRLRAE